MKTPPATDNDVDLVWSIRKSMWEGGFRPVPIYSHDRPISQFVTSPGKQPSGGKAWHEHAGEIPPRAVRIRPSPDALNTGVLSDGFLSRSTSTLTMPRVVLAVLSSRVIEERLGPAPVRFRRNSSKITLLYKAAEGEPRKRTLTGSSPLKGLLDEG